MNKTVLLNIFMNIVLAAVFVWLNGWALQSQFEETFITLALAYGIVVTVGNAAYVTFACRQ